MLPSLAAAVRLARSEGSGVRSAPRLETGGRTPCLTDPEGTAAPRAAKSSVGVVGSAAHDGVCGSDEMLHCDTSSMNLGALVIRHASCSKV